ncbi:MAG TPA: polyphosphate kinase 2 [Xanthomonadales bacterium]|nr:polyphosphate kinase 2 [Xanthomonadales bacterium]
MGEMKGKDYREALEPLQEELNAMHRWLQHTGQRLVVVFEGRDTAGKGGAINAISDCLNPRTCRIVALSKPSDREKTQWYFQRYVEHLPSAGEIVLFDRSWYNRAGVERVMGFCTDAEYARFLDDCPQFERMLINSGVLLFKYWFACDQSQQETRLAERLNDPVKRWKISPIDLAARERYNDYTRARDQMLDATDIPEARWTLVDMNDQKAGRLNMIRHLLDHLPDHDVAPEALELPPLSKRPVKESYPKSAARAKKIY